jgi:hypothetical protein
VQIRGRRMNVRAVGLFSLLVAALHLIPFSTSAASLRYEPAVVELSGTVVLEEHFGPPGFGEDPKTDLVELTAVLVLDAPISVVGDTPGEGFNQTSYPDVRRLQLVRGYSDPPFSPYAGKHVVVLGALYEGFTGHHHTDVLVRVERIAVQ